MTPGHNAQRATLGARIPTVRGMTTPAPTTTITLTKDLPAALRDELGIAAADDDSGDVLTVEHDVALRLVRDDYANFGSAAEDASKNTLGQRHIRRAAATLDFPSVAAGAAQSLPVNVPGAKTGEGVAVIPPVALDAALVVGATVTAANTVTVTLANPTAGAIDPVSGDFTVAVVNGARR